jgi:PKD repeat protein
MTTFKQWMGILLLCFLWSGIYGQQGKNIIRCETTEADAALREQFPQMGDGKDFEQWLAPKVRRYQEAAQLRSVVTLPIVFHIIHNGSEVGSPDNVAAELVYAQIEQANNDFRRKPGTSGYNEHEAGADIEIEFCPAYFAPDGSPLSEPGIHRINRHDYDWPDPPFTRTYIESFLKGATQFDPEKYINVWVLDMQSSSGDGVVLGYSQLPSMSGLPGVADNAGLAETDGVAIAPFTVGSTTQPNTSGILEYGKGRSLTHELGHFFGLRHIWGDAGCGTDDFCEDTPESDAANTGCSAGHVSCGTEDMIENYMDYTDDDCMNTFTQDQKARMITVLTNSPRRKELMNSTACVPLPAPDFTSEKNIIQAGENVQFTDQSLNNPDNWSWTFEGGTPQTSTEQHPLVTYETPGLYAVTLTVKNAEGENTIQKEEFMTVVPSVQCTEGVNAFPYAETLDGDIGLFSQAADDDLDWIINQGATSSGNTGPEEAAQGSHYLYLEASGNSEKVAILNAPCMDFYDLKEASLSFQYHMRGRTMGTLDVQISTDEGASWSSIWLKRGEQSDNWEGAIIDLKDYTGLAWVGLRFVGTVGDAFLSDMAIDDIVISGEKDGMLPPEADFSVSKTQVYVGEAVQFNDLSTGQPASWSWSFEGGQPDQSAEQNPSITYNAAGTYPVSLTVSNEGGSDTETKTAFILVMEEEEEEVGCENGIKEYPYNESFESGMGGWSHDSSDDFNWTRHNKKTPSSSTGPSTGAEGQWFLYTEASSNYNSTAIIHSPCFDLTELENAQFDFQYHMFGAHMGSLSLEVSTNKGQDWTRIWSMEGDQSDKWHEASVDLTDYIGYMGVSFRFVGQTGNRFRSDMAIDNVSLTTSNGGDGQPPVAAFEAGSTYIVAGEEIQFTDLSAHAPDSWSWSFEGGEPAESNEQHPIVWYPEPGVYTVSLTAANEHGNDIVIKTGLITVIDGSKFCAEGIDEYPYFESFESGLGGWQQDLNDDFDWTRHKQGTPSSVTGPDAAVDGTWYLYTEASLNYNNTAAVMSPCFDLTKLNNPVFSFYYNMYGIDVGTLQLEISINDGANWSILWQLSGNRGKLWKDVSIDLSNYAEENGVRFRFVGTTGDTYRSDIAIDEISLLSANNKTLDQPTIEPKRSFSPFTFAPNPAKQFLNINFRAAKDQRATLRVSDILGRQLISLPWPLVVGQNDIQLDIDHLQKGTYLLSIQAGEDSQTKRFIKN